MVNKTLGAIDPFVSDNRTRNYNSAGRRPHTLTFNYSWTAPNLPRTSSPILRAGLGMVGAMLELLPTAEVWHLGLYRDERTLRPVEYYNKLPDAATVQVCLVLDTMLATGGSAVATIDILKKWGAARIKQVSLIAAPEGVAVLSSAHPDVDIHVAALDSHLNERGYIVPGLGDAGDRQFGTFAGPGSEPGRDPDDETVEVVRRLQRNLGADSAPTD